MLERVAYRDAKQIQSKNVYSGLYVVFEVEVAVMLVEEYVFVEELAVCSVGGGGGCSVGGVVGCSVGGGVGCM